MKKNRILNVLMFINLVLIICQLQAQNERSLFFLPDIPQRKLVNPAAFPDHRLYVGVPILSSLKMGFLFSFLALLKWFKSFAVFSE